MYVWWLVGAMQWEIWPLFQLPALRQHQFQERNGDEGQHAERKFIVI